jgi:hypothetical protein
MSDKPLFQRVSQSHYNHVHTWLLKEFGSPAFCEFCFRKDKKCNWALKRGCEYNFIKDNFLQLCCSCHRRYDTSLNTYRKIRDKLKGKPNYWNRSPVIRINGDNQVEYGSIKEAASENNMLGTSIINCLAGKSKTSGGYKWKYKDVHV